MNNVLILSVGTRNKIVQYFKEALSNKGVVIAADCNSLSPALYEADKHYIVPRITELGYLNQILSICKMEKIKGVFSLIDPELSLLSFNQNLFSEIGVTVLGSSYELCELTLNKWKMYQWLTDHGYRTAKSYIDIEDFHRAVDLGEICYPIILKPICGSASLSVQKIYSREMLEILFADGLMIQEWLSGSEIGVDCYIDMISGEITSIFLKKKLLMRAGETDKAVSFLDKSLFELVARLVKESGLRGQIDIDIFDVDGEYYISEVNPRFGGGYPHAHECGCDHVSMIINNLQGNINKPHIGEYKEGIYMMKYSDVMTIPSLH